jgi:BirA family biotin operon repressor/biotin-[acetyl-CoA-carboxylase] ligase
LISEYPKLKTSSVECFQTIDSTNTYAKKLLAENIASTLNKKIIVAESQTKGRGRLGRFFCSPEKTGIYLSIIYVPEYAMEGKNIDPAKITAFSAVAVCRVIKKLYNVEPKIKWINDIYLNQKKIAGILTEGITNFETGCIEACVIGIGINIQHNEKSFPEDVAKIAGSIIGKENNSEQTKVSRAKFAAEIAGEILSIFDEKKENIMKEYKAASFLIGSIVNVYSLIGDDTSVYKAKVLEIDDNAGLVVELSNGTKKTLNSGEVTLHSN